MVVIMFYDQELTVEPFATEVLATASNTMGVRYHQSPFYFYLKAVEIMNKNVQEYRCG